MDEFYDQTERKNKSVKVLDSLKRWRTRGWQAAGQNFKIKVFAQITPTDHEQVKRGILISLGVGLGFMLPDSAKGQFDDGQPWEVISGPGSKANSENGHYVYVSGYTKDGPVCVTWGSKQKMTWEFVDRYCDEAYAIIDDIETPARKQLLDGEKINEFLKTCARVWDDEHDGVSPP
jgi:hypothetical protein